MNGVIQSNLFLFTLALDAMPWLACTFSELMRLRDVDWQWVIVEGAAMPLKDTAWMKPQEPRLSGDGTTEFLDAIAWHPRVRVARRERWDGKTEMCNHALSLLPSVPAVLMQVDGDELWTADQLRDIRNLFDDDPTLAMARFDCDYMIGPNVRTTDAGKPEEWLRAWRYAPGMRFTTHEPPVLAPARGKSLTRQQTGAMGLRFQHHAWTLPKHVAQKEALYGKRYVGALAGWEKLQRNRAWPVADAGRFLPAAFKGVPADRIF